MASHGVVQIRLVGQPQDVDALTRRLEELIDLDAGGRQDSRKERGKVLQYGTVVVERDIDG